MLSVEDVRRYLQPHGINVIELSADTSTAPLAALALGTEVRSIAKSLLFLADGRPVLVVVAGDRRVDRGLLASEFGATKVRLAKPVEVNEIAGYAPGGVPPVALAQPVPVLFDRHLLRSGIVYAAAGGPHALFAIEPKQLMDLAVGSLTDATVSVEGDPPE